MPRVRKLIAKGALKGSATGRSGGPSQGASGGVQPGEIADALLLKFDDRRRQRGFVFGGKGTCIEFDFPEPPHLHTDDLLVLDDGSVVEVVADIEPVIEVRAKDLTKDFAAVASLLVAFGNRHIPVQILTNRIRLQKQPEVEALVAKHGLKAAEMAAPFEPDDGGHDHGHDHHHGHGHDHGAGHGHGNGHGHHHQHGDGHGRGRHHHDGHEGHHHHDK